MGWWFLPIAFWAVGLLVMIGGVYIGHKISEAKEHLHENAELAKHRDRTASMYFGLEGKALDMIPWVTVRLVYLILGMIIFALGFVALSFII
ncbi:MAG TPA: hypothetical protein VF199_06055 [Bacillales bacterium]